MAFSVVFGKLKFKASRKRMILQPKMYILCSYTWFLKKDFLMFPGAFSTIHELKLHSQLFFKKHSKVGSFYSVNVSLLIMQIYIKTKHI